MDNYKITFGIEPTERYLKAKQDIFEAWNSLNQLTVQEQECLMKEIFGVANIVALMETLKQYLK